MLSKVTIIDNVLDDTLDEVFEHVENVADFLMNYFDQWPATAKLYRDEVSSENEIKIESPQDVRELRDFVGHLIVVIYPAGIGPGGVLGLVLGLGASLLVKKRKKKAEPTWTPPETKTTNNKVSERTNTHRLRERIPDIFGEVVSILDAIGEPDLVSEYPTGTFEYALYCIGRGEYAINAADVKEGNTPVIDDHPYNSIEIFGPYSNLATDEPQLRIGQPIARKATYAELNSQSPPSHAPLLINASGTVLTTEGSGIYRFDFLYNPHSTNNAPVRPYIRIKIQKLNPDDSPLGDEIRVTAYAGYPTSLPFTYDTNHDGKIQFTFVKIGGTSDEKIYLTGLYDLLSLDSMEFGNVTIVYTRTLVEWVTVDPIDTALLSPGFQEWINTVDGRKIYDRQRAAATNRKAKEDTERKLNIRVTRKVPIINNDNSIGAIAGSKKFSDILYAICTDPYLGNLDPSAIDVNNLRTTYNDVIAYFGHARAGEFGHSFDDADMSFEEMFGIVAEAAFCYGYRRGDKLRVFFEKENDSSSILFNHRNKLPNSEQRTVLFGVKDNYDGVEIEYTEPTKGEKEYLFLPEGSARPEKTTLAGVQNKLQAYFHAHRLLGRLLYQNTAVEFEATSEALLLLPQDRILVADNTRSDTFDGEIVSRAGDVLNLSQNVVFTPGSTYTIFLQNADGTIVTKAVTAGVMPNQVILASTSGLNLALDNDLYARATYEIVKDGSQRKQAFLVEEKEPKDNFVTTIRAVNYDARYYEHDKDLINDIVDQDGNTI